MVKRRRADVDVISPRYATDSQLCVRPAHFRAYRFASASVNTTVRNNKNTHGDKENVYMASTFPVSIETGLATLRREDSPIYF